MYIHPYQILTLHCRRNKVFLLLLHPNLKPDEIKKDNHYLCPCHNSNFRRSYQHYFLAVQSPSPHRESHLYLYRWGRYSRLRVRQTSKRFECHASDRIQNAGSSQKYDQQIHTGAYRFDASINTLTLFRRLSSGHQTPVKVVIPSVRTLARLTRSLDRQLMPDSTEFARLVGDSAFCASLGFSLETMPALFIPNTYEAYWNTDAEAFIRRMKKEYERFWTQERKDKAQACGLTPVEVSTLASIVEEETANKSEMPMVAELYLNRLQAGMPLQADPTIKFSLQEFGLRRILHKHLEVESPYNTYKHAGLPPGPIRIASIQGIESVLNHAQHDYLYMCAKEDFSGTHNFAATFAEHQANARRYQQALNKRNIR